MAASTERRSPSVRATNRCRIPAPKSKPSSTTYTASISATIPYQTAITSVSSFARGGGRRRAARDLAADEVEEQDSQHQVEAGEADGGEGHAAGAHRRGGSGGGALQAVDEPRLAAELRAHPAGGGCNVGE